MWINEWKRAVIAWHGNEKKILLVGLDAVEEIIRYRQGDPSKVKTVTYKGGMGFDYERPNYLFEDQIVPKYKSEPWADNLGFFLAETFSRMRGFPLVEVLPEGAKGAIILTGDDDQALLEQFEEQLKVLGDFPITYFLVPQTRYNLKMLNELPVNVDIGVHPDALDNPTEYSRLCTEQTDKIREMSGKPVRTIRNHGFLNNGYLGHLKAWEDNGLKLDVNYPGVDGTALNASLLPMRVRRQDNSWSDHYSLLTVFGDGIINALNLTQNNAAKKIRCIVKQIEEGYPGVLVFNFHPQNLNDTHILHREVVKYSNREGWIALGLERYLDWLELLENLKICYTEGEFLFISQKPIKGLVLRHWVGNSWKRIKLEPWSGKKEVYLN